MKPHLPLIKRDEIVDTGRAHRVSLASIDLHAWSAVERSVNEIRFLPDGDFDAGRVAMLIHTAEHLEAGKQALARYL
jgi:hypothetical protein